MVTGCTFCAIVADAAAAHRVMADDLTVSFLDVRPVFKGHVLVVPRAHHETLADLPADLLGPFFGAVQQVSAALPAALGAQGSFVGLNNTVSQSVPHLHAHVVPRTKKDGLRGFFWPRTRYASEAEAAGYAGKIAAALGQRQPGPS
jgi:histidine triad (HIT) family protein